MSNVEDITQIKLNSEQENAVEQMLDFAQSPNLFFRLDGAAGTGKSTCSAFFAREALGMGIQMALAAPTNKATRNLGTFKDKINPTAQIATGTIYSQLGLVLGNDGEVRQVQDVGMHKLEGVNLVLVDEWSMINTSLMGHIHSFAMDNQVKFIFMGDPYQLPPVNEDQSAVERLHCNARLDKVERHDNQILSLATHLRECIDRGVTPTFRTDRDDDGGVSIMKPNDFRKMVRKVYCSPEYDEYPDAFKTIAWRNAIVDDYNESIRDAMYNGNPATPFEIGERIVVKAPVMDLLRWRAEGVEAFSAITDEEGTVQGVQVMPHPVYGEVECYCVTFSNDSGRLITGYLPTAKGARVQKARLDQLASEAKMERRRWPAFWQYKQMFADLAPSHALTTHRSQGSTYRSTFVDLDDLWVNYQRNRNEGLRMIYTACTRASKALFLKKAA